MHRQDRGQVAPAIRVQLLERVAHEPVQAPPLLLEERLVRGVLDEGVAEEVLELGLDGGEADQPLGLERVELQLRHVFSLVPMTRLLRRGHDALEHAHRELPSDDRGDAQRALGVVGQLVDAREQKAVQRVGDLDAR